MSDKAKPDYQRFFLTELVALIQRKYKVELTSFFFENKREYILLKPSIFDIQINTPKQSEIYGVVFIINFFYFKITRSFY